MPNLPSGYGVVVSGPECGPYITTLLARVRDPQGAFHSRALVRDILSRVQQIVNAHIEHVFETATLVTDPYRQVYVLSSELPNAVSVASVYEEGRTLTDAGDWRDLAHADRRWFRSTGARFESYAMAGRDLLIITPGKPVISSVDVKYVKLTTPLVDDGTPFDLHDEDLRLVMDVAEAILLARARDFGAVEAVIANITQRLGMVEVTK